jgi:hypothetical protein
MQPLVTFAILPQDECLEQALSEKKDETAKEFLARMAKAKWAKMSVDEQKRQIEKMHEGRWGKKKKKRPKP